MNSPYKLYLLVCITVKNKECMDKATVGICNPVKNWDGMGWKGKVAVL
jgi:hypothetical protein